MAPAFAQFEQQYRSRIQVVKVDLDNKALAAQYRRYKQTRYIPETIIVRSEKVVFQKTGTMTFEQLVSAVDGVK